MFVCSVCNDEIYDNDDIKCNKCKISLHFACAGLRESNFRKMSAATKGKWFCINCRDSTYATSSESSHEKKLSLENLTKSDKLLMELKESVNFMSRQFDDFNMQLRDISKTIKEVKEENKQLKEDNKSLKNEINLVNKKINFIEQKLIENHIEIVGVPEKENEDCIKIVEEISKTLGESVSVLSAYRFRSKVNNKYGKIVAVLNNYINKKSIMNLAKKKKLKATDVNVNWNDGGIYINNCLTHANNNLFYKTRMYAKEHNYKYVWFSDCKIFLKKDEKYKVICIEDINSLNNIA